MDGAGAVSPAAQWVSVCRIEDIWPDTGVCALVDGRQIAVFRVRDRDGHDRYHAIDNHDPQSQANVLSRGLIGSIGARTVVASPIYKQHYDLTTGECLEDAAHSVRAYAVRVDDDHVWIAV
ncbi:nitrite reductase (NADH) small subunit [Hydrocarboniphaga daqingensis]|uniref:Nitrite reductase (NADH) small subunit n=1 Tax=Hydrocarboniphaga daqingensis TaxID=490188 RepID=A0A1M5JMV0_9GAMM|nr:nitrite reductase small subunit NirD [Hydrocarboniphaga daqingensis]SHG41715.1 nitrite reductase (NADH) small subunit [Hydrocarboniphaga daqingensis]